MNRKVGRAVPSPPGRGAVRTPRPTRWRGSWPRFTLNTYPASLFSRLTSHPGAVPRCDQAAKGHLKPGPFGSVPIRAIIVQDCRLELLLVRNNLNTSMLTDACE